MKKIFLLSSAIMVCFAMSAQTITRSCVVTMKGVPSGTPDELRIYEVVEATTSEFYNGFEATHLTQNTLPTSVNIYVEQSYGTLSRVALPDITGMPFIVKPNGQETNYSLTFTKVNGEIKVEDLFLDSTFVATNNLVYNFTIDEESKGTVIANRFRIYKPFTGDDGELSVCAYYSSIEIQNNPYTTDIVVKDMDGNAVLTKTARATPQVISLENLASGHYVLEIGGESYEFFNKPEGN